MSRTGYSPKVFVAVGLGLALLAQASCANEPLSPEKRQDMRPSEECISGLAIADFSVTPTRGTAPLAVSVAVDIAALPPSCDAPTLSWFLNDIPSGTSHGPDAFFTFHEPGAYSVTVTAITKYQFAVTQPVMVVVQRRPPRARPPLHMYVMMRVFEEPVTTFSATATVTAEAFLDNPYDYEVVCDIGYTWGSPATFRLYDAGVEVARSGVGVVLWMMSTVAFQPGESSAATSTVNTWKTSAGADFALYPGVFTVATVPEFMCRPEVYSEPATIVVTP